ncbi:MAG: phosphate acyltransferase PlsX [Eubacterium sp.]|jgi:glycerol-3-phosphate acyltransferase PlsX
MRIIVDGMGGDNAPLEIVRGCIEAASETDAKISVIGKEEALLNAFRECKYEGDIDIINASEVISNDEAPSRAVMTKKDSSIVKALEMLKRGEADAFVSAGSTGAMLAGGMFVLGRIPGIDRPAIATIYPIMGKEPSMLLDAGANANCKPNTLLEFAMMASIYMEKVIGRENPTIGLVNNGTESHKGSTLTKATYENLKNSSLNFIGNVEARDLPFGAADIYVTDGFTGNVILKLTEGMAIMMMRELKKRMTSTTKAKIGALMMKDQLKDMKAALDYAEYGGAPILGVKGIIVKMHGSSDAYAVKNAILATIPFYENKVIERISDAVLESETILEEN